MQAWQDGLKDASSAKDFATDNVRVNFWDTLYWGGFDSANDWANKGYQVVISNPDYVYFDMPYEVNPSESGYYWATRASDEQKSLLLPRITSLKMLKPQWIEMGILSVRKATSLGRAYMVFQGNCGVKPSERMIRSNTCYSLAFCRWQKRAWHKAQWENDYQSGREYIGGKTQYVSQQKLADDWNRFATIVGQKELRRLDRAGVAYRIPVPGAKIENGVLLANISYPSLIIEYALADSDNWQVYSADNPPKVNGNVKIRAKSPDGARASRVEIVTQK